MRLWESWLAYLFPYVLACFKFVWRSIKVDRQSRFLLLPPEILLEIIKYLDYRALVGLRQVWSILLRMYRV